ncbi:hypothetical protein BGZ51_002131 [Haplosporangium sp. Z 767]|nr:hypothetical protein BGZ51_002131 [Haplosporangium sp. Z 767]
MSGPDQTEDAEAIVSQDHKNQQQNHTRIRISNLLCPAEASRTVQTSAPWDSPKIEAAHVEQPRNPVCHAGDISDIHPLSTTNSPTPSSRALTAGGPCSHYDFQKYSNSPAARTTNYEYANHSPMTSHGPKETRHSMDYNQRRDSGLGRREIDLQASGYSPRSSSNSTFRRDPTSFSMPVDRSPPLPTSPAIPTPSNFSSQPPLSGQRSSSFSVGHFRANPHLYDVEQFQKRHDRAKSDFALHQQNYGPYLAKSPTPEPAFPYTTSRYSTSHPVHDSHGPSTPPPPQPQASYNKPNAYFHDSSYQSDDQSRPSYHHMQDSRRSFLTDSRRASQGIILPSPESWSSKTTVQVTNVN